MKCPHCRGQMKRSTAPFRADRRGYHIQWDSLPAWVCTQCGEPLFEVKEVDAIQNTLDMLDQRTDELAQAASG